MNKFKQWLNNRVNEEVGGPMGEQPMGEPGTAEDIENSKLSNMVKTSLDRIASQVQGMNKQRKMKILQIVIQMLGREGELDMAAMKRGERQAHASIPGAMPSGPAGPGAPSGVA